MLQILVRNSVADWLAKQTSQASQADNSIAYNARALMHSYVSGPSEVPLLGETIGRCLDRITSAYPDRDALVSCHQELRFTYRRFGRRSTALREACSLSASNAATASGSGARTARSG